VDNLGMDIIGGELISLHDIKETKKRLHDYNNLCIVRYKGSSIEDFERIRHDKRTKEVALRSGCFWRVLGSRIMQSNYKDVSSLHVKTRVI
jgi:hypothetical protein